MPASCCRTTSFPYLIQCQQEDRRAREVYLLAQDPAAPVDHQVPLDPSGSSGHAKVLRPARRINIVMQTEYVSQDHDQIPSQSFCNNLSRSEICECQCP